MLILSIPLWISCNDKNDTIATSPGSDASWVISQDEVVNGGPGKDGIPSIDDPLFASNATATYMQDDDLIIGIHQDGVLKGYPHPILDWHEIVNDKLGGHAYALTYCPLTGTGIAWNRNITGSESTFGVSGLLYRNNLIPYDRKTGSNWSQIRLDCVHGLLRGDRALTYPVIEMPWATWKRLFPNEQILSNQTGFNRSYGNYPYGSYKTDNNLLLFPVGIDDTRLPKKERVLGVIIDGKAKVYQFQNFQDGIKIFKDVFMGEDLIVIGSNPDKVMMAYKNNPALGNLQFLPLPLSEGGIVMKDQFDNKWNIFGEIVSGPSRGSKLEPVDAFMGYWFAFGAFYPKPEIFEY
jgi:hypothetical protein